MAFRYPGLTRRLSVRKRGGFYPFTYSIGLQESVLQALASVKDYPLAEPVSDEVMRQFESSLTFFHEAAHLTQYISSAFGLHMLRRSLIALYYLVEGGPWQLPVGQWLLELPDPTDQQETASARFLNFIDAMDQLTLHVDPATEMLDPSRPGAQLFWEPWSPYVFWGFTREFLQSQSETIPIFRQPNLLIASWHDTERVTLNGAALMEGYAMLVELNHMANAFGLDIEGREELAKIASSGNQYVAAMQYGLTQGAFTGATMIPALVVCIDLALMYDPFVLYNSPDLQLPDPGVPPYQYPGETFVAACSAAGHIAPINDWDDLGRFYAELCDYMGLPSPEWMAKRAYEVASNLLSSIGAVPAGDVWLGSAVAMHKTALELRLKNPQSFAGSLVTSNGVFDVLDTCTSHVSYFRLASKQPEGNRYALNIDLLTVHSLILQTIMGGRIDCPLKEGIPFFCPSALSALDDLCVFQFEDGSQRECLVDLFEQRCKLRFAHPTETE